MLDLCYTEDSGADVDMNVVMSGTGDFIELQGTAEGEPFDRDALDRLLDLGAAGCAELTELQQAALAGVSPPQVVLATHNAKKLAELRRVVEAAGLEVAVLGLADVAAVPRAGRDRDHLRGQRPDQGAGLRRARRAGPRSPTTPGSRWTCSTACPGSVRPAGPARGRPTPPTTSCCSASSPTYPTERRTAQFVCAMALVWPDGSEVRPARRDAGAAARPRPRGENGFGYDPLFVADGHDADHRRARSGGQGRDQPPWPGGAGDRRRAGSASWTTDEGSR